MAEEDVTKRKRWKRWSFIQDLGLDVLVFAALNSFKNRAAQTIGEKAAKTLVDDDRGDLLKDFSLLPSNETNNLIRRHQAAIDACKENRFITLLCKIPKDKDTGRQLPLKWLNSLDDRTFNQMLELLENDVFVQYLHRAWKSCGGAFKVVVKQYKQLEQDFPGQVQKAKEAIMPSLDGMADWAESLPGARPKQQNPFGGI